MTDNRERVREFLAGVDRDLCPVLERERDRLIGSERLLRRYREARAAWVEGRVTNVRGITEAVNELVVAQCFLEDPLCEEVVYEMPLVSTPKTIDFVFRSRQPALIFYDVKTVHPESRDRWDQYVDWKGKGYFTGELILDERFLGGEIAHDTFASRERFLEYAVACEEKIRQVPDRDEAFFRLIFCGDGFQWHLSQLEDFADAYRTGRWRADDTLGRFEAHAVEAGKIRLDRTIGGFCYLERPKPHLRPRRFLVDVRGPRLP